MSKPLRMLYISNTRDISNQIVSEGHDVHLRNSINSLRSLGIDVEIFFDHKPIFKVNRSINLIPGLIPGTIDHFYEIVRTRLSYLFYLKDHLKECKPDIIYERSGIFRQYLYSPLSIPYFLEVHAPPDEFHDLGCRGILYYIGEQMEINKYKIADTIITVSNALKQFISQKYLIDEKKIFVLPNGVDTNIFFEDNSIRQQVRSELELHDKIVIGFVGPSYIPWHNLNIFFSALIKLTSLSELAILFVGATFEELRLRFKQIQYLEKKIKCISRCSQTEVNRFINAMDICVLPGTNWYCSPIKLFEYGAVGRPIIAVDMPNIREIFGEDEILYFKKNNSDDLAKKILLLSSNLELRIKLAEKAKSLVVSSYTWQENAKKKLMICQQ